MARQSKTIRRRVFEMMEVGGTGTLVGRAFDLFMILLVVANITAMAAATIYTVRRSYFEELFYFEVFSLAVFIIEYLLRFWVCVEYLSDNDRHGKFGFRLQFLFSPLMIIDFLAIAPIVGFFFVGVDLRFLLILRLLRIFKLTRYSPALSSLGRVIYEERRALTATMIIMMGMVLFSAAIMYYVEGEVQPDAFGNIPIAMWWSLTTLTTVGYGDVVPVTVIGKLFGGIVMIFGLAMYALPIGIIASGFSNEIHRQDFVVRWGLVAGVPLFSDLDAAMITNIAKYLRSRVVQEGKLIARAGDRADKMYLIVSGEVARRSGRDIVRLQEGAFFGVKSLIENSNFTANYVATSRCQLLVLEVNDYQHLMANFPEIEERLKKEYESFGHEDYGQPEGEAEPA
ncbi:cyclic nucleotide-gated ion channel [Emcibacter nanhaiensis]|uniref:Cyclic nucleotide-binding domain-containing protein n=1 Tax=Emcibacter nanhaiensis TaxID=1505037 RepID=A0A501PQQ3_9PROT|nr:cyclic nucleotide-gated ion channel [Emcibacter nanhaiensis]TPD62860.1 cyclic nucleotide-binding domain-containing protein [Emcibacter nanhaiensis]